jgi:hypothetical protein
MIFQAFFLNFGTVYVYTEKAWFAGNSPPAQFIAGTIHRGTIHRAQLTAAKFTAHNSPRHKSPPEQFTAYY